MSLVAAADYYVEFRPGKEPEISWKDKISDFLAQPEIKVMKRPNEAKRKLIFARLSIRWNFRETRSL